MDRRISRAVDEHVPIRTDCIQRLDANRHSNEGRKIETVDRDFPATTFLPDPRSQWI